MMPQPHDHHHLNQHQHQHQQPPSQGGPHPIRTHTGGSVANRPPRGAGGAGGKKKTLLVLHPAEPCVVFGFPVPASQLPPATPSTPDAEISRVAPVSRLPRLCPSCLPASDPAFTPCCPPQSEADTAVAAAAPPRHSNQGRCPHFHAALDKATQRHHIHRRDGRGLPGHECYKAAPPAGVADAASVAIEEAPVMVAMPGKEGRDTVEPVRPSTCLVTLAQLDGCGAAASSAAASSTIDAPLASSTSPTDSTEAVEAAAALSHCAHWLQRGLCVYGAACRFVHCLEPSPTAESSCAAAKQQARARPAQKGVPTLDDFQRGGHLIPAHYPHVHVQQHQHHQQHHQQHLQQQQLFLPFVQLPPTIAFPPPPPPQQLGFGPPAASLPGQQWQPPQHQQQLPSAGTLAHHDQRLHAGLVAATGAGPSSPFAFLTPRTNEHINPGQPTQMPPPLPGGFQTYSPYVMAPPQQQQQHPVGFLPTFHQGGPGPSATMTGDQRAH